MIKIERESLDQIFGGKDAFDALVADYKQALADHAETEGVPAPMAHAWVEQVVRLFGGEYELIEPEKPAPVQKPTLVDLRAARLAELAMIRYETMIVGVGFNSQIIASDVGTLSSLMAAHMTAPIDSKWRIDWKTASGQFITLSRSDIFVIIEAIRKRHQAAFSREAELNAELTKARNEKALNAVDIESMRLVY